MTTMPYPRAMGQTVSDNWTSDVRLRAELDVSIRQRLDSCGYRHCFNQVCWDLESGTLVLRGRVPSFYLKQVLQTMLRDLGSVGGIDNQVEVVSSTGLST